MEWSTILSCILISAGAIVMLRSIINHRRLMQIIAETTSGFSHRTSILVRAHMAFMVFFFVAYLVVIFFFISKIDVIGNLFIGLIFLFGAIFVYTGIVIQRKSIALLNASNSELRKYAEDLEANQNQLLTLNDELKAEIKKREMAQHSEQLKSDFLSQVSHELRTPITSIFGFAKLMKKDFDTIASHADIKAPFDKKQNKIEQNISIIISECSRLTRMINNVLDLAKIEAGETTWNDAPIPLVEVINSSMTAVRGLVLEKETVKLE